MTSLTVIYPIVNCDFICPWLIFFHWNILYYFPNDNYKTLLIWLPYKTAAYLQIFFYFAFSVLRNAIYKWPLCPRTNDKASLFFDLLKNLHFYIGKARLLYSRTRYSDLQFFMPLKWENIENIISHTSLNDIELCKQ